VVDVKFFEEPKENDLISEQAKKGIETLKDGSELDFVIPDTVGFWCVHTLDHASTVDVCFSFRFNQCAYLFGDTDL